MLLHLTAAGLILLVTSGVVALTALLAWNRRDVPAGAELFWLFAAVLIWGLGAALAEASSTVQLALFWSKVEYIGSSTTGAFTLIFCLSFARRSGWRRLRYLAPLWALPIATIVLAATNEAHHLIWTRVIPSGSTLQDPFVYEHGPAYWLYIGYNYAYTLAGAAAILREYLRSGPLYRRQAGAILFSMIFPWLGGILYSLDLVPVPGLDITPISFAFTALVISWAMFSTGLLDLIPVAHDTLFRSMQDGILVLDGHGQVVESNPAMAGLLGRSELPIGEPARDALRGWPALAAALAPPSDGPVEIALPGEMERYFDVSVTPIRSGQHGEEGQLAVLREITGRKQAELALQAKSREMEHQAVTDDLTGLHNRRYISRLLAEEFSRAERYGTTFCVGTLDIDDFKQINDRYGHLAGDEVLRCVAEVLRAELRLNDVAARVGGDEFMVILPHTPLSSAMRAMERVRASIRAQAVAPGNIHLSCSVGLTARLPEDTQESLLQRADRLLYAAKEEGRNRVQSSP